MTTDTANDNAIDTEHRIFDAFSLAGFSPVALVDPGRVTPEDIEEGGWTLARWNTHGVTLHDIEGVTEAEWAPAGVGVEYGAGSVQPIAFAGDEHEPLNAEILDMSALRGRANASVVFLVPPDVDAAEASLTPEEAVRALALWGSEGYLTRTAADTLADAFGVDSPSDKAFRDDPDADGVRIARAPSVVSYLASAAIEDPDLERSDATGHKKRRRVKYYSARDALADAYGVDIE